MRSSLYISLRILIILLFVDVNCNIYPKWPPTYQMNRSTIIMTCNASGYMSQDVLPKLARYGIVDIDWSNAKQLWANTSPMDCQQRLLTQAQVIKSINPETKVFVYRNLAKALPWFTDIREKLLDPEYNKYWFLPFKPEGPYNVPQCTNTTNPNTTKCSNFYHDQNGTPQYKSSCHSAPCDCGEGLPCGEYVYDHRNASLRQWLTDVFIMGSTNGTGLNNPAIDGFYIDDGWTDHSVPIQPWEPATGYCDHNSYGGVEEEDYKCVEDMGLNSTQVEDIYQGWKQSESEAQQAIVNGGGWNWQLFTEINGSPNSTMCTQWLQGEGTKLINRTLMFSYSSINQTQMEFDIDLAIFLLVRGKYAWIGYHWNGCHKEWIYPWNYMLDEDYGEPTTNVVEISNGVFQRKWSKCVIQMDCNQYKASFNFTDI